jgi:hypothetical protein
VSQWYIFNDFTINPIPPEEAVWFNLKWKIPCIICFTAEKLPLNLEKLTLKVTEPLKGIIRSSFVHQTTKNPILVLVFFFSVADPDPDSGAFLP